MVKIISYFPSGETLDNTCTVPSQMILAPNTCISNQVITVSESNYYAIDNSYLSSMNLEQYSIIFKLKGPAPSINTIKFGPKRDPFINPNPGQMIYVYFDNKQRI